MLCAQKDFYTHNQCVQLTISYTPPARVVAWGDIERATLLLSTCVSQVEQSNRCFREQFLSYYSHFPKSLSVKHGIERRITARAEKFRILLTESHICNAQRTHSKTSSTLRLIYHSRISRLRTELCFWLGEKVSLNSTDGRDLHPT